MCLCVCGQARMHACIVCVCVCPACLCVSSADRALSLAAIRFWVFGLSEADSPVTTAASPFPESLEGFLYRVTLPENPHLISALEADVTHPEVYLLCLTFISLHFSIVLDHRARERKHPFVGFKERHISFVLQMPVFHPASLCFGFDHCLHWLHINIDVVKLILMCPAICKENKCINIWM